MIDEKIIEANKILVEKYPFLGPKTYDFDRSKETGEDIYMLPDDYDYSWTYLDGLPNGWVKAFGEQMCEELKSALDEYNYMDKYVITDVKEKYGGMRIYDNGVPRGCKAHEVIDKYSRTSDYTCIGCGKPATKLSVGWICPFCDECASKHYGKFRDIQGDDDEQ